VQGTQVQGTESRHRRNERRVVAETLRDRPEVQRRCYLGYKQKTHPKEWMRRMDLGGEGRAIATRVS
jgi:cystathionine beta-lyase/cystathionine gamma-synthase